MTNMLRVTAFPHLEMATKALVNSLFPHDFHKLIRKFIKTYQRYPRGIIPIPQTSDKLLPLLTILSAKLYTSFDSIPHPSPLLLRHIFTIPLLLTVNLFFKPIPDTSRRSMLTILPSLDMAMSHIVSRTKLRNSINFTYYLKCFSLISHNPHANLYSCLNIYPITTLFTVFPRGNSEDIKTTLVIIPNST